MEMVNTANSHAGLADVAGYSYAVYCNGVSGLSNSCSGNSVVVAKLSNSSGSHNSHVRQGDVADDINYPSTNHVCLSVPSKGTVSVGYQAGNCSGYDTTLFSMAKTPTNSHVGDANAYTNKVCASANLKSTSSVVNGFILPPTTLGNNLEPVEDNTQTPENNIPERVLGISNARNNTSTNSNQNVADDSSINVIEENQVAFDGAIFPEPVRVSTFPDLNTINESIRDNNLFSAASIFGSEGFLPEGPLGWSLALLLLVLIILLTRKLFIHTKRVLAKNL
jgi:hypothetical protein